MNEIMKPKFSMTKEQNIFVAKRNIIDYIWKDANLEGIAVTYPDTEAIYNGYAVQGYKVNDIVSINNLKHAWQFLLDNIDYSADYPFMCKINQLIGGDNLVIRAGFLRNIPVNIGGTSWKPEIPVEQDVISEISEINRIDSPTQRAITLMLYGMRKQMFIDGNKRTSMMAANQIMISNGAGVIAVPVEMQKDFTAMLVQFYQSGEMKYLKQFIYDNCIDGIAFDNTKVNEYLETKLNPWDAMHREDDNEI